MGTVTDSQRDALLDLAAKNAKAYLDSVADRPVPAALTTDEIAAAFGGPTPENGRDPREVLEALSATPSRA